MQFPKSALDICGSALPLALAVALLGLGANPAVASLPGHCVDPSGCNLPSGGSSGGGGGGFFVPPSGPTPAEIRAAERFRQMKESKDRGHAYFNQREWAMAVAAYEEALQFCDIEEWCANIRHSLAMAGNFAMERSVQREAERQRQEAERQRQEAERQRHAESQRQLEQAKQTIGGMLDDLASQWGASTPSDASGEIVFLAPGEPLFSKPSKAVPVDVRDLEVATGEAFKQGQDLRDFIDQVEWPVKVKAAFMLGVLMAERGRYDEAFDYFLEAAHAAPYDPAHATPYDPIIRDALQEAMSLKAAKAESAADAGYLAEEVVDPDGLSHLPLEARAGVMVAAASVSVGDYDAAIRILGEAAEAAPGDEGIRDGLVYVRQLKAARDDRAAGPPDPELLDAVRVRAKGNAAWGLGLYLAGKGDYDGAVRYFNEARPVYPDGSSRDMLDLAIANVWDMGGEIPGFPIYRSKAGAILYALEYGKGDWDASLRYLEVAHDADPNNLDVRDALNYLQGLSAAAQFAESQ